MFGTIIDFTSERAPCGEIADGYRLLEDDSAGLLIDDVTYTCGCRRVHHEFHDGSVRIWTQRHDGKVLRDERSAAHEA